MWIDASGRTGRKHSIRSLFLIQLIETRQQAWIISPAFHHRDKCLKQRWAIIYSLCIDQNALKYLQQRNVIGKPYFFQAMFVYWITNLSVEQLARIKYTHFMSPKRRPIKMNFCRLYQCINTAVCSSCLHSLHLKYLRKTQDCKECK